MLASGYGAGYGAGDSISIVFERPTAAGLDEEAHRGDKAFVDGLFAFTSSEDIYPLDDSCVGRRCSDGRPCRKAYPNPSPNPNPNPNPDPNPSPNPNPNPNPNPDPDPNI